MGLFNRREKHPINPSEEVEKILNAPETPEKRKDENIINLYKRYRTWRHRGYLSVVFDVTLPDTTTMTEFFEGVCQNLENECKGYNLKLRVMKPVGSVHSSLANWGTLQPNIRRRVEEMMNSKDGLESLRHYFGLPDDMPIDTEHLPEKP